MKTLLVVVLFFFMEGVLADITWLVTPPTEYTDNRPILAGDIEEHRLYCNGKEPKILPWPEVSYTNSPPIGLDITCYVTTVTGAGLESAPSNSVTKISEEEPVEPLPTKPPVLN